VKAVRSRRALSNLARCQQLQLLGHGRDEVLENPHLLFQLLTFSLPLAFRDQPLYGISGQV